MKHFKDEEYDSMKEYETNITHHHDIDSETYTEYGLFRHWLEDENDGDTFNESTIKHFQD